MTSLTANLKEANFPSTSSSTTALYRATDAIVHTRRKVQANNDSTPLHDAARNIWVSVFKRQDEIVQRRHNYSPNATAHTNDTRSQQALQSHASNSPLALAQIFNLASSSETTEVITADSILKVIFQETTSGNDETKLRSRTDPEGSHSSSTSTPETSTLDVNSTISSEPLIVNVDNRPPSSSKDQQTPVYATPIYLPPISNRTHDYVHLIGDKISAIKEGCDMAIVERDNFEAMITDQHLPLVPSGPYHHRLVTTVHRTSPWNWMSHAQKHLIPRHEDYQSDYAEKPLSDSTPSTVNRKTTSHHSLSDLRAFKANMNLQLQDLSAWSYRIHFRPPDFVDDPSRQFTVILSLQTRILLSRPFLYFNGYFPFQMLTEKHCGSRSCSFKSAFYFFFPFTF
jgi:hypothetical protein